MDRPRREHLAALVLAGTALALVGGICGYFGTDFGYHLWSAARCTRSSCLPGDAPWWMRAAGALAGSVAYVLVALPAASGAGQVESVRLIGDQPVDGIWPSDHAGVLGELQPATLRIDRCWRSHADRRQS